MEDVSKYPSFEAYKAAVAAAKADKEKFAESLSRMMTAWETIAGEVALAYPTYNEELVHLVTKALCEARVMEGSR